MGVLSRMHGIVSGVTGTVGSLFGIVKDIATAPWNDDVNGAISGVVWRSSLKGLGGAAENLFGPNEGLGSVIGAAPAAVRDPVRSITQPLLKGAEWLYREGLSEPASAALTTASMGEAPGGGGFGAFFDGETWDKAYEIAQHQSWGQSLAIALGTKNVLDRTEVEKFMLTDQYQITSGLADAVSRFYADPLVVGGHVVKAAREVSLGRGAVLAGDFDRALNSTGTQRFIKKVDEIFTEQGGRSFPGLRGDLRDAVDVGDDALQAAKSQARELNSAATDKTAAKIRDQFFPDHVHGDAISRLLAESASTGDTNLVVRHMLGDVDAAGQLVQKAPEIASKLARLEDTAADVAEWGEDTLFGHPGRLALIQEEMATLTEPERYAERVKSAYAKMTEAPRVSVAGEIRSQLKETSWVYQKGPLSTVWHTVFDMKPNRLLHLNGTGSDATVSRFLAKSGLSEERQLALRGEYMGLANADQRLQMATRIQDEAITSILDKAGIGEADRFLLLQKMNQGLDETRTVIRRIFDVDGRGMVAVPNEAGSLSWHHTPLWNTQQALVTYMPDLDEVQRLADQVGQTQLRAGMRKGAALAEDAMDRFYRLWKPGVLLRAGWPIRVVGDEQVRILSKIGVLSQLKELAPLGRELKDSVGRVSERLRRVPPALREERPTYHTAPMRNLYDYEREAAFGTPGELENIYTHLVDSAASFRSQIGGKETELLGKLRTGSWETIEPGTETYARSWEQAVNLQIGQDQMARQFLAGKTAQEVEDWLQRTPEGRTYARSVPRRRPNLKRWSEQAEMQVLDYVPAELRQQLLETGKLSHADLMGAVPDVASRPLVHGEILQQALKGSPLDGVLTEAVDKMYNLLGRLPSNHLSRSKFFDHVYRSESDRLTTLLHEQLPEGERLTITHHDMIAKQSREHALGETKKLLYDLSEESNLAGILRHVAPFFMAWQEVLTRWTGLAIENPAFIARMREAWMAPEKMGWVVDEDGREVEWDGSPDEYGKERYILTSAIPGIRDLPGVPAMKFNKKSFNSILQGAPGFGPPVQIPVNEIIKDKPELEESFRFIMPFGSQEGLDIVMPTMVKRATTASAGDDSRMYTNSKMRIFGDMMVDYNLGKVEDKPTWADANKRAQDFWSLRTIASALLPAQPTILSPYQMYIDAYRQRKNLDPQGADAWFLDTYGEEFFPLTQAISKTVDGVAPTLEGKRARAKYQTLIEKHPELGSLIIGSEGTGEFNSSVYRQQLQDKVSSESSQTQRRSLTQEEVETGTDVRLGWEKYGKAMDLIEAERIQRGLPNLQVKAASQLAAVKKAITAKLADEHPAWYEALNQQDGLKWPKRIAALREISDPVLHPELQGRSDIRKLGEYIRTRDSIQKELARRKEEGGYSSLQAAANQDVAQVWSTLVGRMTESDTAFQQLYFRYLERDRLDG